MPPSIREELSQLAGTRTALRQRPQHQPGCTTRFMTFTFDPPRSSLHAPAKDPVLHHDGQLLPRVAKSWYSARQPASLSSHSSLSSATTPRPGRINFSDSLSLDTLHLQLPALGARKLRPLRHSHCSLCVARSVSLGPKDRRITWGMAVLTLILAAASAIDINHVAAVNVTFSDK